MTIDSFRQRHEAKQIARDPEEKSEGAKVSATEAPAPGQSPHVEAGGSGEALPKRIALPRQCVLETMHEILVRIHALCIQTVHEMGSVQEFDRTLAHTLMAEFMRLQLIVGEDLTKSLITL